MKINIRLGNFGVRWSSFNMGYEFVRYEGNTESHYVIAFYRETSEGYDLRTVGDRFWQHGTDSMILAGAFMETLTKYKMLEEDMNESDD